MELFGLCTAGAVDVTLSGEKLELLQRRRTEFASLQDG
jgi:hypothetical protein